MSLLVVGSIAFDSIKTPESEVHDALGGSSVYFSLAASRYVPVRLVGVVGGDFPAQNVQLLEDQGVDAKGIEVVPDGRTFRWSGEYFDNMNRRETLSVELNVFEDFEPKVPSDYRDSAFVFLANGGPGTQASVLDQVDAPRFTMADTMDLWIQTQRDDLLALLRRVDGLLLNDDEALLLTAARNIVEAGRAILKLGPERVVIKKGEHGAILFTREHVTPLPAFPVAQVRDPTGAGDSFAGAVMGYLASRDDAGERTFKTALAHGIVASSFCVEDFGVRRLTECGPEEFRDRFRTYRDLLRIDDDDRG